MATNQLHSPRVRRRPLQNEPVFITRVTIKKLFGQIDYTDLDFNKSQVVSSKISVIYGDNGTGKTTLLHLIYSVLSPENKAGLRTFISKTPFEYFGIKFSDGSLIQIDKIHGLIGSFRYRCSGGSDLIDIILVAGEDNTIDDQDAVNKLQQFLFKFKLEVLFVDHERYIRSTYKFLNDIRDSPSDNPVITSAQLEFSSRLLIENWGRTRGRDKSIQFPLKGMVEAVNQSFRSQAFQQGNTGEQSASAVYLDIAKALIRPKKPGPAPDKRKVSLSETLDQLKNKTDSFTRYGLLPAYPFDELKQIYETASKIKKTSISDALNPFVTSILRRTDALQGLHDLLLDFETELNKYLSHKFVSVHAVHGLSINDKNGQVDLSVLSSGEKQLVFLLCAAVVSRKSRSLILIDEPELSLNYKWQRMISGSLGKLSSDGNTQFIMASHSIEIISRYKQSAIELKNDYPQTHG